MSQLKDWNRKAKNSSFSSCSVHALNRLDDTHLHGGGKFTESHHPNANITWKPSYRHIWKKCLVNIWAPCDASSWHVKLTITPKYNMSNKSWLWLWPLTFTPMTHSEEEQHSRTNWDGPRESIRRNMHWFLALLPGSDACSANISHWLPASQMASPEFSMVGK